MTEEGFWDLAEEGARVIVLTMQWLLVWPFVLLGWAARHYAGSKPLVETPKSDSMRSTRAGSRPESIAAPIEKREEMRDWRCINCKEVVRMDDEPAVCPVCRQRNFVLCASVSPHSGIGGGKNRVRAMPEGPRYP